MMPESEKPKRGEHLRYLLTAYVFESISEAGRREVEEHLGACAECRAELEELRGTVAKVEDAFADEAGGAAGYSFEARRLERVLAAGSTRQAGGWLERWRKPVSLAAAAVLVVGIGWFLLSPTMLKTPAKGRSAKYELAARGEQPAFGVVPARSETPALADKNAQGDTEVAFYAKDVDLKGVDAVQRHDDSLARAPASPAAAVEADVAAITVAPVEAPAKEVTRLWAAPEVALQQPGEPGGATSGGRATVAENGRVVINGPGGGVGGAGGAYRQRWGRGTLSKEGGSVPAAPAPPAEPSKPDAPSQTLGFGESTQATELAQAVPQIQINETQYNRGVEGREKEKTGADRWGDQIQGEPVEARRSLGRNLSVAGEDGVLNTFDDRVVIAGGGDDYSKVGGEGIPGDKALSAAGRESGAARPRRNAGAANAPADGGVMAGKNAGDVLRDELASLDDGATSSSTGTRSYNEKVEVGKSLESLGGNVAELYKKKAETARERLEEESEVRKLAEVTQEVAATSDFSSSYATQLKRDAKTQAGEKQIADGIAVESRSDAEKDLFTQLEDKTPPVTLGTTDEVESLVTAYDREQASRAVRFKNARVRTHKSQPADGWAFGGVVREGAGLPSLQPPDPSAAEGLLRGFAHYKALDQGLTLDEFSTRALKVPSPTVGDEGLGQEGFRKRYGVNPFVDTRRDHFSTFGMDVDTASYTLARGALAAGKLPDPGQVRVEEFVNYFPEDVAASRDRVFSVRCEGGPSPFGEGLDLLKVTVKARDLLPGERKDAVLTFAVDTSGSMHEGNRLTLVREALSGLVRSLKPDDRVAVVGFSDHPYLVLPHTPAREADRILGAVASLTPRGDTNFEAGLSLAYRVADEVLEPKAVHRVILCSDGVATAGARGAEEILKRVEVFAKRGIYLSCVGFGMGKYNDRLLETLADKGNGNYAYADDQKAAADVFQKNLPATLQVLAQDAKVQVDFNTEVVSNYRLVGYENRDIADRDFRNDKVDAGEVGPGTTVTVLYEVLRRPGSSGEIGKVHVRYKDTGTGRVEEESYPLPPGVVATRLEETSDRFRFIASAAETAELLRGSYWARNGSYGKVLETLHGLGAGFRERPDWKELAAFAARAQELTINMLQNAR